VDDPKVFDESGSSAPSGAGRKSSADQPIIDLSIYLFSIAAFRP